MRTLVSGASGMIGRAITTALEARGDVVHRLVRDGSSTRSSEGDVTWDPMQGTIDGQALANGRFDAVLHLAGESLLGRWTDDKRDRIMHSRESGTRCLGEALATIDEQSRPRVLVSASATGFYGSRGDELLTESSPRGNGFLAGVVERWEAATTPAVEAGVRVVRMRMAPVQSTEGGALAQQLRPFQLGLGGRLGDGRQWWPWIGLDEAVRAWLFALDEEAAEGPVNVVGPTPARNIDYVKALGRTLRRPTVLPTPVFALKAAMGSRLVDEMLLTSQKVVPARLESLGFEFGERTIDQALRHALGR